MSVNGSAIACAVITVVDALIDSPIVTHHLLWTCGIQPLPHVQQQISTPCMHVN